MTNEKKPSRDGQATMSAAERHADVRSEAAFFATMPNGFTEAFQAALDWRGVSQAQLAADAQLPEATVSEIIGEKRRGRLHNVMRMCIAARLPWDVSAFLLNQGGYCLRSKNRTHVWYRYVLKNCVGWSLEEVQIFLEERGVGRL